MRLSLSHLMLVALIGASLYGAGLIGDLAARAFNHALAPLAAASAPVNPAS